MSQRKLAARVFRARFVAHDHDHGCDAVDACAGHGANSEKYARSALIA